MPDPNNPLSYIGNSNDPTLKARTEGSAQGAIDLQRGLAQIMSQGQNQRANTTLQGGINATAADRLPFQQAQINPDAPNAATLLDTARLTEIANKDSGTNLNNSAGALNRAKFGVGSAAPAGSSANEIQNPALPTMPIARVGDTAAASGVPKLNSSKGKVIKTEAPVWDEKTRRLVKRTETDTVEQKAETKGPISAQRAATLHDAVTKVLTGRGIPFKTVEILDETDTHIAFTIDGGELKIKPKG